LFLRFRVVVFSLMPLILLSFSRMAVSLRAIAAIEKTVIAAMTTPIAESALEVATKRNSRVFAAYIVVQVLELRKRRVRRRKQTNVQNFLKTVI
jgi:hypothetical protein